MSFGIAPGGCVEFRDGEPLLLIAFLDKDRGIESAQGNRHVGDYGADAGITGKEAVIAIVVMARVTHVPAFFKAADVAMTIIPAAGMLGEIAAQSAEISNLPGTDLRSRLLQAGKHLQQLGMIFDLS